MMCDPKKPHTHFGCITGGKHVRGSGDERVEWHREMMHIDYEVHQRCNNAFNKGVSQM